MIRIIIFIVFFMSFFCSCGQQEETIPFSKALKKAGVAQAKLTDIRTEAFVLGNGDMNALLWEKEGSLHMRVTKNDIWDARINTSQDPELLRMDIKNRRWEGGTSQVPSWNDYPYPQPRCAAEIIIRAPSKGAMSQEGDNALLWNGYLDLKRAKITLQREQKERTIVRSLIGQNIFLIEGPGVVSLKEVIAPQLPAAKLGEKDGVKWLHMNMPGDLDYQGMEYALAVASKGDLKAVSLVTSYDTRESVLESAIHLVKETLKEKLNILIDEHEDGWEEFWSASGLELDGPLFQDAWYRNMYYMRCFCQPGTSMPVTLYAGLANDEPGWHGAPTLDYNIEQVFWPMFSCNQVDLMEPYVAFISNFAPRARWLAQKTYGVDGIFLPVNIFGPEHLVAPENAKSNNARQIAYVPWTYGLGLTGWALQNLWLRYKYQPDIVYLESVYPLLRDGANFYANVIELCQDDDGDGKIEIGPSYNPEHGPFGSFNNPVDITYFNFLLKTATKAAGLLKCDEQQVQRWTESVRLLPNFEKTLLNGKPIVANWKGAAEDAVQLHNVASPIVPIFPAEQVSWFSSTEEKELFERTLRWIQHNGNNSHIMLNVARARLSMPEAYNNTLDYFGTNVASNGLFAEWKGHGHYLAESWAFAGLTAELLLQSVNDIIRVFPAWPKELNGKYKNLRAQGGFLVSAEQKDAEITQVEVVSTVGGQFRILSPWEKVRVINENTGLSEIMKANELGIVTFDTKETEKYRLLAVD